MNMDEITGKSYRNKKDSENIALLLAKFERFLEDRELERELNNKERELNAQTRANVHNIENCLFGIEKTNKKGLIVEVENIKDDVSILQIFRERIKGGFCLISSCGIVALVINYITKKT